MSSVSQDIPNLGKYEALDLLADEFKYSEGFAEKAKELQGKGYTGWRRTRGDGNCFYRSVGFAWLEEILKAPKELQRVWAQAFLDKLLPLQFSDTAEQAAHRRLAAHVDSLARGVGWQGTPGLSQDETAQHQLLEASFMDAELDLALVRALRRLIGKYLVENADDCSICNGISFRVLCAAQGQGTPEEFCRKTIFAMGVEAEMQIMRATVQALRIRLQIVLVDRAEDTSLFFENYDVLGDDGVELPLVHVQHRPGHYDIIYRNVPRTQAGRPAGHSEPVEVCQRTQAGKPAGHSEPVEECQRYFCRDCGCPYLWRPSEKPYARCQQCGNFLCVACLAEASHPKSWSELAGGIFSKQPRNSAEHICPHVAAQLESQEEQLRSLKAQLEKQRRASEQEVQNYSDALLYSEERCQELYSQTQARKEQTKVAQVRQWRVALALLQFEQNLAQVRGRASQGRQVAALEFFNYYLLDATMSRLRLHALVHNITWPDALGLQLLYAEE